MLSEYKAVKLELHYKMKQNILATQKFKMSLSSCLGGSVGFEHMTLDFSLDHDPRVMGLSPTLGSVLSMEPA